jgi:glycerol-3-phosphate acyltransferase PlsY
VTPLLLVVGAYLLGAVPFSYLLVRWLRHQDVRAVGSGNAGATNVLRAAGRLPAIATLLLDITKGAAPVVVARALDQPVGVEGAAALAAVFGHVFPVYLGFRGGKGVATAAGAFAALSPQALGATALLFALTLAWRRIVSLASLVAALAFPPVYWLLGDGAREASPVLLGTATAISLLVLVKHRDNLRRLMQGCEPTLGSKPAT